VGGSVKRTERLPWPVDETWLTTWVWVLEEVCALEEACVPRLEALLVGGADEVDAEVLVCWDGLGSKYTDPAIAASAMATASTPAVTT